MSTYLEAFRSRNPDFVEKEAGLFGFTSRDARRRENFLAQRKAKTIEAQNAAQKSRVRQKFMATRTGDAVAARAAAADKTRRGLQQLSAVENRVAPKVKAPAAPKAKAPAAPKAVGKGMGRLAGGALGLGAGVAIGALAMRPKGPKEVAV